MRKYSTAELDQRPSDVRAAAARWPVIITEQREDKYVLMSIETFRELERGTDHQRVYGPGETPGEIAELFLSEIDKLLPRDDF